MRQQIDKLLISRPRSPVGNSLKQSFVTLGIYRVNHAMHIARHARGCRAALGGTRAVNLGQISSVVVHQMMHDARELSETNPRQREPDQKQITI